MSRNAATCSAMRRFIPPQWRETVAAAVRGPRFAKSRGCQIPGPPSVGRGSPARGHGPPPLHRDRRRTRYGADPCFLAIIGQCRDNLRSICGGTTGLLGRADCSNRGDVQARGLFRRGGAQAIKVSRRAGYSGRESRTRVSKVPADRESGHQPCSTGAAAGSLQDRKRHGCQVPANQTAARPPACDKS